MNVFNQGILEEFINEGLFEVETAGPLHHPINELKVERDQKLNIILTTSSAYDAKSVAVDHPPGTVRINEDSIELRNRAGIRVIMEGILPLSKRETTSRDGETKRTELSSVSSVKAVIQSQYTTPIKYLVERLENVDSGYYLWPDSVDTETSTQTLTSIGPKGNTVEIPCGSSTNGSASRCLQLTIGGHSLYLISSGEDQRSLGVKSGFLLYLEPPEKDIRKKIRNCLSFVLGRPLVEMGHSTFDFEWNLISFEEISAYSMGGTAFSMRTLPPYPTGKAYQGELDKTIVEPLLNSLYLRYEELKFGHLSWAYWHANTAPIHIAAVHFGSCMESLQNSYIENHGKIFQTSLMERTAWKVFRLKLIGILSETEVNEEEKEVLTNKINSLNQTPQSILTDRFLDHLELKLSEDEKKAWKQRNNAAHGREIEAGKEIQLIRELKILKVIFHRVLLKIISGSGYYIDYYSIGFPIKSLADPIVDEN